MNQAESERCTQTDDDACGQLWEIYCAEAQRHDEGLVKSWKEDMDVILVFSGLYSAVLTGFVLESYKNLQPDYSQATAEVLRSIAVQLATASTRSNIMQTFPTGGNEDFVPSVPALACNVLWFLSLTLALSCAFLATFVQQWTRHFLHRTTILRSSTARARLFSFLYFGLKKFGMHTIVDVIPTLLHLSLFSFFSGLVAFLWPVNKVLTWLIMTALVVITTIYLTFTILPVVHLDSPFQTPMSPLVWWIWKFIRSTARRVIQGVHPQSTKVMDHEKQIPPSVAIKPPDHHLTGAMIAACSKNNRRIREATSLVWALRSLNEDTELLPFIEALSDVICGAEGPRTSHFHLIRPLLETTDPQIDIITRTMSLLSNADNTWFTDKHRERCWTTCPKLIWSLAYVLMQHPNEFCLLKTSRAAWFSEKVITQLLSSTNIDGYYSTSAIVLCRLNAAVCAETLFTQFITGQPSQEALLLLNRARTLFGGPLLSSTALYRSLEGSESLHGNLYLTPQQAKALVQDIKFYRRHLLSQYLSNSSGRLPYRFELTVSMFDYNRSHRDRPFETPLGFFRAHSQKLEGCTTNETQKIISLDRVFAFALDFCQQVDIQSVARYIHKHIVLHGWGSTSNIWTALPSGFSAFCRGISTDTDILSRNPKCISSAREVIFCLGRRHQNPDVDPCWRSMLATLKAIPTTDLSSSQRSLVFMIKFMMLNRALGTSPLSSEEIKYLQRNICLQGQWMEDPSGRATTIFEQIIPQLFKELFQTFILAPFLPEALTTLLYVSRLDVIEWVAFRLDATPQVTYRLACETERLSRMCESELSTTLVDVLAMVWRLWISWNFAFDSTIWGSMQCISDVLKVLIQAGGIISAKRDEIKRVLEERPEISNQWGLKAHCNYDLVGDVEDLRMVLAERLPYFVRLPPADEKDGL